MLNLGLKIYLIKFIHYTTMKTENTILQKQARESLRGKWGLAIGTSLVYMILSGIPSGVPFIGSLISIFIAGPLALGMSRFSLSLSRNEEARIEQLFSGFENYSRTLSAYLVMILFIIMWMLLLIVPGIIKALSFSMTFYILADDKDIPAMEAIKKSEEMMNGNKLQLFYLGLRFLGLALLCILTLGIGFLWLMPYVHITVAKFYDDIKETAVH
jgi:uncharacterized membrane protein